ncbi:AAA family ATPase [Citroniella saccharovorans]|uniref:AAA family ATPase n=1 Tax=Citroniella saccharovorans TaxID=2053367 RepID=A0AAW9MSP1_9FIRM|nr:AAA family ATPase [Citroniella saccharovorans]MEB3429176.1 AAA family ATPase [Citroniella saccharovorans]
MKSLMIQGTTSSSGKSLLCTGLARIFSNKGIDVFPFKSQNMSSKFVLLDNGDKMATAQYIQAIAARIKPSVYMNPILLVPKANDASFVYYLGKEDRKYKAVDYFKQKEFYKKKIIDLYKEISNSHDLILIEGAGSPAEINLNQNDFVNSGMAEIANSNVLIVTDIDRGGSFAHLYGTYMLLGESAKKKS